MFGITARASALQLFVTVMSTRRKCHFIMQNYKSMLCNKAKYVGSVHVWTKVKKLYHNYPNTTDNDLKSWKNWAPELCNTRTSFKKVQGLKAELRS